MLIKKDLEHLIDDTYLEVAAEKLGYKTVAELKKTYTSNPYESYTKSDQYRIT
jgi:hypothetical protein